MNKQLMALTLKGLQRRRKNIVKVMIVITLVFAFVAGVLLTQENMSGWQAGNNKMHFGDWFIMYRSAQSRENEGIKKHPYIKSVYTAKTVTSVSDGSGSSEIMIGTMSDSFMKMGSIKPEQGRLPESDDEIAMDRNSLNKLAQGTDIGDDIVLGSKEYTLCGIMNSYTSAWNDGKYLPGIIVTEHEADNISKETTYIYAYSLKNYINEQDYKNIAENIKQDAGSMFNFTYNSNVYDYKPSGYGYVNSYIYVFIMLIGIAAVSYQIVTYNKARKDVRLIQKNIGADVGQLIGMTLIENVVITGVSAITGSVLAIAVGAVAGYVIKCISGVTFFTISRYTYTRLLFTLAASILISFLTEIINGRLKFNNCNSRIYKVKSVMTEKTFVKTTADRLRKADGPLQLILTRFFAVAMAVITILCTINCVYVYKEYMKNGDSSDIVAYATEQIPVPYTIYFDRLRIVQKEENTYEFEVSDKKVHDTWEYVPFHTGFMSQVYFNDVKCGRSYSYKKVRDDESDYIKNINGVADVTYGYYETARTFTWTGINADNVGGGASESASSQSDNVSRKYIFAAEYVEPEETIYNILNNYAEGNLDYDAFRDGSEVIVFLDVNNNGKYDESMKDGVTLKAQNYLTSRKYAEYALKDSYSTAYDKLLKETIEGYVDDTSNDEINKYVNKNITNEQIIDIFDQYMQQIHGYDDDVWQQTVDVYNEFKAGNISKEQLLNSDGEFYSSLLRGLLPQEWWYNRYYFYTYLNPAATSKVVKVVKLTDEIKEQFKEIVPEFGQYTIIGSTQFLQNSIDSQNELIKKYLMLDELPDYMTLKLKPNQINIRYNLGSSLMATDNIVSSYLGSAGFAYTSYAEYNNQLRQKTIGTIMTYGITGIAAIVIYLIVSIIVLKGRLEKHRSKLKLLSDTGAEKEKLVKICMNECIRESLWFIVLMPVEIPICLVTIRKFIKKIEY